jgi:hypothetical protein
MNLHAIAEKQKSVKNLHARMSHENLHARLSNELTLTFGHMTQNLEGGHFRHFSLALSFRSSQFHRSESWIFFFFLFSIRRFRQP